MIVDAIGSISSRKSITSSTHTTRRRHFRDRIWDRGWRKEKEALEFDSRKQRRREDAIQFQFVSSRGAGSQSTRLNFEHVSDLLLNPQLEIELRALHNEIGLNITMQCIQPNSFCIDGKGNHGRTYEYYGVYCYE